MANPTPFVPGYSYSGWQATNPSKPLPGPQVDNDFANASRSIREIIEALGDVRRSDGALANQSVGPDQLSGSLSLGFTLRGAWREGYIYSTGDGVVYENAFYAARVQHQADATNAPGDEAYWNYLFSIDDLVVSGALSMPVNTFIGNGVQQDFDLSFFPISERNLLVKVGGLFQDVSQYTVDGSNLHISSPPPANYPIEVRGFSTTATLFEPADGSVTEAKLSTAVAASIAGAAADATDAKTTADAALALAGKQDIVVDDIAAAQATIVSASVNRITTKARAVASPNKGGATYFKTPLADIMKTVAPQVPDVAKLFLPLNGPEGTVLAYDLSPNARTVTVAGQCVVSAAQKYYDQNMMYLDGVGDNINVPASADFAPAGTFSMSVGVCVEDLAAERPLFTWTTNSTAYIAWSILPDGSVQFRQRNGGSNNIEVTSAPGVVVPGQVIELGLVRYGADKWQLTKRDPSRHNNPATILVEMPDSSPLATYTGTVRIGQLQATGATFKGWLGQFWFKLDPSWEGAEDYLFLPTSSYFKTLDGAWWLLSNALVNPEMLGAAGDAVMSTTTGLMSGTNDKQALRECQEFCAIMGKEMRLISGYWWSAGVWEMKQACAIRGANRRKHGVYIDTDRTQPGFLWLSDGHIEEEMFVSVRTPSSIQNGQGYFGTTHTFSRPVVRPKTRHVGEPALDYGMRCTPPEVKGVIRSVRLLRRAGGSAHCLCATSRCKGVDISDIDAIGWNALTGRHGSFLLSHWGFAGLDWAVGGDGIIIEPMITPIATDSFTMHPSNVKVSGVRLRNVGRMLNTSASYDITVEEFSYVGTNNGSSGDGGQIVAHTVGDEWDMYAHPDDAGRIWANLVVKNGQGYLLEANSPNGSDRALISVAGAASSKTKNIDGTFAKNDLGAVVTVTPGVIAPGGTVVQNVAVSGVTTADAAKVNAWFSQLGDKSYDTSYLTATVVTNGQIQVTFKNPTGSNLNLTTAGSLNAYLPKQRSQKSIVYSGMETKNIRAYGVGGTGSILYLRNGEGQAVFENIQFIGDGQVDGLLIQNWSGPTVINNCKFPGNTDIGSTTGLMVSNSEFRTTALLALTLGNNQAIPFAVGDVVTGGTSGVVGTVQEVHSNETLYVRHSKRGGKCFVAGETITSGAKSGTIIVGGVTAPGTGNVLVRGNTINVTTATGGIAKYAEVLPVNSISQDIRPGDKLTSSVGTVWATGYHDVLETSINITPAPAAAAAGVVWTVDRRSSVVFDTVDIIGGYRGLTVNNCDFTARHLRISEAWQYGMLQDANADVNIDDLIFADNGQGRVALDAAMATRDYVALGGAGGTLTGKNWKFRDGKLIQTNIVIPANSLFQASLRDSTFVATGQLGAALNKSAVTSPLSGGAAFSQSNNVDSLGAAVTL